MARPNPEVTYGTFLKGSFADGGPWQGQVTSVPVETFRREYQSVNTPGFSEKDSKALPVNPHSVYWHVRTNGYWTRQYIQPSPPFSASLFEERYPAHEGIQIPNVSRGNAKPAAIAKLANNVSGMRANLLQSFAERQQTVDMFTSNFRRIARAVVALRHLRFGDAAEALGTSYRRIKGGPSYKYVPAHAHGRFVPTDPAKREQYLYDRWLELQYGWKPLLQDVYGSFQAWKDSIGDRSRYVHRAEAKASYQDTVPVRFLNGGPVIGQALRLENSEVCIFYNVDEQLSRVANSLGLDNPALLAWELFPWSFVADWALPIGEFLSAQKAYNGLVFKDGYVATRTQSQFYVQGTYHDPNMDYWSDGHHIKVQITYSWGSTHGEYAREKLFDFPRPGFPALKNPLSLTHALNAIALVGSAINRVRG